MKNRRLSSTLWGSNVGLAGQLGQMSDEASGSNGYSRARLLFAAVCRLVAIAAAAGSRLVWEVLDRYFIVLQQILQYDVSYQMDIGQNLSSADRTLTNRRENARC